MKKKIIITLAILSLISIIYILYVTQRSDHDLNHISVTPTHTSVTSEAADGNLPDDKSFNNAIEDLYNEYPWYTSLPIDNENYHIVYDFNEEKFRIRLKYPIDDDKLNNIVEKAKSDLKKIGVKEPINYYIFDSKGNRL